MFLTDAAPIVPLSRVAVKCIVRRALGRAGVDSPHRGHVYFGILLPQPCFGTVSA